MLSSEWTNSGCNVRWIFYLFRPVFSLTRPFYFSTLNCSRFPMCIGNLSDFLHEITESHDHRSWKGHLEIKSKLLKQVPCSRLHGMNGELRGKEWWKFINSLSLLFHCHYLCFLSRVTDTVAQLQYPSSSFLITPLIPLGRNFKYFLSTKNVHVSHRYLAYFGDIFLLPSPPVWQQRSFL